MKIVLLILTCIFFFLVSCSDELNISVSGTVTDIDKHEPIANITIQLMNGSARGHGASIPVLTGTKTNSQGQYSLHYTIEDYKSDIECFENYLVYFISVADGQGYAPTEEQETFNLRCTDGHQTVNLDLIKSP